MNSGKSLYHDASDFQKPQKFLAEFTYFWEFLPGICGYWKSVPQHTAAGRSVLLEMLRWQKLWKLSALVYSLYKATMKSTLEIFLPRGYSGTDEYDARARNHPKEIPCIHIHTYKHTLVRSLMYFKQKKIEKKRYLRLVCTELPCIHTHVQTHTRTTHRASSWVAV